MMAFDKLKKYKIILASKSPRRQYLLKELGLDFEIQTKEVEEIYPVNLKKEEIAKYLAELKAKAFNMDEFTSDTVLITADTIVCLGDEILPKPKDEKEAVVMLKKLSGTKHEVITGVCLKSAEKTVAFTVCTEVSFKTLSEEEILYYIHNYKPFDKAGAYGIQEWIGYIGIDHIKGSFYNVMALPVQKLHEELLRF